MIILVVSIPYLKKKISVSQIIKEYADALIGAGKEIYLMILPFILWKSDITEKNKLFANSDTFRLLWSSYRMHNYCIGNSLTFNNEK